MMKFLVERASLYKENPTYKEFSTVEELCDFVDSVGQDVIIERCLDGSKKLLIYDDYIE